MFLVNFDNVTLNRLDLQMNPIFWSQGITSMHGHRHLSLGWSHKLVFQQDFYQQYLNLHQGEPHPKTYPWACSEWHELIGVSGFFGRASESLGVKLLRVFPGIRVVVKCIERYNYFDAFGDCNAVDDAILGALAIQLMRRREHPQRFVYDTVKVFDALWYLIKGSARVRLHVFTNTFPQLFLDIRV